MRSRREAADEQMAAALNATDPDLSAFRERGGKLILFHGWSDAAIPAVNAVNYYEAWFRRMGASEAETFVRLYMVPGMQHCGGGPGPNVFGQVGTASGDRSTHRRRAGSLGGTGDRARPNHRDEIQDQQRSEERHGAHASPCTWPMVAKYKGSGSTDDELNFVCGK